jgi:tRNA(Ile)-lysidine synthase
MRMEEPLDDGIILARPLLAISRSALAAIAVESGLKTVADPSNSDLRFDRIRMRALMPTLAEHGLDAPRLAETATRLGRAAEALDYYAGEFLQAHFSADSFGVVSGSSEAFADLPEEVALRALARVLKVVGGADYTPPLAGIEALHDAIVSGANANLKRTLSGVVVSVGGNRVTAEREWGRDGLVDEPAPAGATLLWDGRFRIKVPSLPGALQVGALGRSARPLRVPSIASGRIRTLPGLYQDGTLVAVPERVAAVETGAPLDILSVECIVGQRLGLSGENGRVPP